MRLVVDANVLFSALLRDGLTRLLLFDRRIRPTAPRFLMDEFKKYAPELRARSGLAAADFAELSKRILARIRFVPDEDILVFWSAAKQLVGDPKDVAFAACALAANAEVWSSDRHFENNRIRVWKTGELLEKIYPARSSISSGHRSE